MSRHIIPALDPQHMIIVGYDPPLETFFAQVTRFSPHGRSRMALWIGTLPYRIPTVEALAGALAGWAILPEEMYETLRREQGEARPPSPLQRRMRTFVFWEELVMEDTVAQEMRLLGWDVRNASWPPGIYAAVYVPAEDIYHIVTDRQQVVARVGSTLLAHAIVQLQNALWAQREADAPTRL